LTTRPVVRAAFMAAAVAISLLPGAHGQSASTEPAATSAATAAVPVPKNYPYVPPTERAKLSSYLFDAFGPYPIVGAALTAGVNQGYNSPPEWNQGAAGYGRRFGSNFGIAAVSTTTRYALAEAFHEDTLYYRCDCKGFFPRLNHALISTISARHGVDGHRAFSFSSLVSPYVGTMTAVYAWYPDRFGAKDGFRMGNYNLLVMAGGNVGMEFFYRGPHSLLSRLHLSNPNAAPAPDPKPKP
jgi:hypothetical protein